MVFEEFKSRAGDIVSGTVRRFERSDVIVDLGRIEALMPSRERVPIEEYQPGDRIRAYILSVENTLHGPEILLSRAHPDFVKKLFELEVSEIADKTVEIKAIAREAGYRTKIAVSSIDMKVDCVGACVGVRGSRIKNIVDELGGERIDIVRWNDSLQVMIPNALQPASVEEVFLYSRLGRAIILVKEDQLSLAIGRRGQNVRLASKLVGWDIEIMTHEELTEGIEKAQNWFLQLPNSTETQVEAFIEEGFLSYDDLTFLEPAQLAELGGCTEEQAEEMIAYAEDAAVRVEEEARIAKEEAAHAEPVVAAAPAPAPARSGAPTIADLFPDDHQPSATAEPPKPTLESLFGPDTTKPDATLSATEVLGESATPQTVESKEPSES